MVLVELRLFIPIDRHYVQAQNESVGEQVPEGGEARPHLRVGRPSLSGFLVDPHHDCRLHRLVSASSSPLTFRGPSARLPASLVCWASGSRASPGTARGETRNGLCSLELAVPLAVRVIARRGLVSVDHRDGPAYAPRNDRGNRRNRADANDSTLTEQVCDC